MKSSIIDINNIIALMQKDPSISLITNVHEFIGKNYSLNFCVLEEHYENESLKSLIDYFSFKVSAINKLNESAYETDTFYEGKDFSMHVNKSFIANNYNYSIHFFKTRNLNQEIQNLLAFYTKKSEELLNEVTNVLSKI